MSPRIAVIGVLLALACDLKADPPVVRKESRSYLIQCRVIRAVMETDAKGRANLERTSTALPDIITVENVKTEYVAERKVQAGLYQFRIQAQLQKVSEGRMRLDLQMEDVWSEGDLDMPLVRRHSLQTARQVSLGSKIKIALQGKNDKDEGIWVELTVKELTEDE